MKYIETERLILREWTLNDVGDMVEGLGNFVTAKNLVTPFPYTEQNAIEYISKHLHNSSDDFAFAIVLKNSGKVVGGTGLDVRDGIFNGGIWLNEDYTGQGFGTEVWIARAKFVFEGLNLEVLDCGYFEFNNRSKHMQEKVGYKTIGKSMTFCPALKSDVVEINTRLYKNDFYDAINSNNLKEIYDKINICKL